MLTKIREAVEVLKGITPGGFALVPLISNEKEAFTTIIDFFTSLTSAEMPKDDFEDFLSEKHAEQYIGTKDCMIDDFDKWVCDLGADELIEFGNKFSQKVHQDCLVYLAKREAEWQEKAGVERIRKELSDGIASQHLYAYACTFGKDSLEPIIDALAQALSSYLRGER